MMTLGDLCDLVGARATLVLEIKSRFDRDARLIARAVQVLAAYAGPVAAMSFDPYVVAGLRRAAPRLRRGIVAERRFDHSEWRQMSSWQRRGMAHLLHAPVDAPRFRRLPGGRSAGAGDAARPHARHAGADLDGAHAGAARARRAWADQMIFEGFRP